MLLAHADRFGLQDGLAQKLASGFGGGIGRLGETCGAVSGAIMVLGLQHGPDGPEDRVWKDRTYAAARDFIERFQARNKTVKCRELLGHDIGTVEGMARIKEKNLLTTVCPGFVEDACEILEDFLK